MSVCMKGRRFMKVEIGRMDVSTKLECAAKSMGIENDARVAQRIAETKRKEAKAEGARRAHFKRCEHCRAESNPLNLSGKLMEWLAESRSISSVTAGL
jgi:hypothetical protein